MDNDSAALRKIIEEFQVRIGQISSDYETRIAVMKVRHRDEVDALTGEAERLRNELASKQAGVNVGAQVGGDSE